MNGYLLKTWKKIKNQKILIKLYIFQYMVKLNQKIVKDI